MCMDLEAALRDAYQRWCDALPCKPTLTFEEWRKLVAKKYASVTPGYQPC